MSAMHRILWRAAVALSLACSSSACVSAECDGADVFCDPFALILYRLDVQPDCMVRGEVPPQGWIFFSGSGTDDEIPDRICGLRNGDVIFAASANDADNFAQGVAPIVPFSGPSGQVHLSLYQATGAGGVRRWTYFGSSAGNFSGARVAESGDGGFYVGASASGTPVTSYLGLSPLASPPGGDDLVLLRFGPDLNLLWYTYLGGPGTDSLNDIAPTDDGGVILLCGSDSSFTIQGASPLQPYTGGRDSVLFHVNSNGSVVWFSFFGAATNDTAARLQRVPIEPLYSGLAAANDRFVVTGSVLADVPAYAGLTPSRAYAGGSDIYLLSFDRAGRVLRYAFYGTAASESAGSVQALRSGEIALVGTSSLDIPLFEGLAPLTAYAGGSDAWLLRLNANGAVRSHRFLGSSLNENSIQLTESSTGDLLVGMPLGADANFGVTPVYANAGAADSALVRIDFADNIRNLAFYGGATSESVQTVAPTEDDGAILGAEAPNPGFAPPPGTPILESHTGTSGDEYYLRVFADGRTTR